LKNQRSAFNGQPEIVFPFICRFSKRIPGNCRGDPDLGELSRAAGRPWGKGRDKLINKTQRRSLRLPHYDYSQAGAYFVTVCTNGRKCLLGEVADNEMRLNGWGKIVQEEWLRTETVRPNVKLDAFIIMPNHLHGIIHLTNVGATRRVAPTGKEKICGPKMGSLGAILGQFKSVTAKRIKASRRNSGVSVWQRNYYEHVIRNENELHLIREYILNNPAKWAFDKENPGASRQRGPQKEIEEILGGLP
jgi:putative transposase